MSSSPNDLIQKVERLKEIITDVTSYSAGIDEEYRRLRSDLINNPILYDDLPQIVKDCLSFREVREWITREVGMTLSFLDDEARSRNQSEIRDFFQEPFSRILNQLKLESVSYENSTPLSTSEALKNLDVQAIKNDWEKALKRLSNDEFDAAITAARSMIESVCKHIFVENGSFENYTVEKFEKLPLPDLYKEVAQILNLAASRETKEVLKKICGACHTIVVQVGEMRNKLSDAHGKSTDAPIASHRHAELAVNLAETLAIFLLQTWEETKLEQQQKQFIETEL